MRRNNPPRAPGGPLMTEHLQLQDIDLELELLKRKREMIEQQQQMLTNNRPRPFEYGNNQPRPLFPDARQPFSNNANFSRFYNDAPQPLGFGGSLGKRHADPPPGWDNPAPKRFSGPQSGPKKKFGAGPGPKPHSNFNSRQQADNSSFSNSQFNKPNARQQWDNKPKPFAGPKSTFPSQRFNNAQKGPKPQQKDFRPNKVTKPTPPQKSRNAFPNAERNKFQQRAAHKNKDDDFTGDDYILRSDVVPTTQMAGRLELALGTILKEIRQQYGSGEHAESFNLQYLNRKIKQVIRERIRAVMLGKPVGKVSVIVGLYRKVFPPATDIEILEIAKTAKADEKLAIKLEGADTAFKYLKANMNKLLEVTLDDMFVKLKNMYEEEDEKTKKEICEKIISDAIDFSKDVELEGADKNLSANETTATDAGEVAENGDVVVENSETENNAEKSSENVEGTQATDDKEQPTDEKEQSTAEDKEKTEDAPASDAQPAGESTPKKYPKKLIDYSRPEWKKLDTMLTRCIERRLPNILPRFKPQIMKLLNAVGSYKVTKTTIIDKTQEMINLKNRVREAEQGMDTTIDLSQAESTAASTPTLNQTSNHAYMVKIVGRPVLPRRQLMQEFLDEYKPASVKKHRNMQMLFVWFDDKDACDRIVAVKETVLENCTITIKASEKTIAKQNETLNESAVIESTEKLIGSDLDEQINDLLSSIREEEESARMEKDAEVATEGDNLENASEEHAKGEHTASEEVPNEESTANGTETANGAEETPNDQAADEQNTGDDNVENAEANDKVDTLKADAKDTGRATPTRASTRLANVTPSTIKTRRASKLAQN